MRRYNILLDCIRIESTDGNFGTHGKVVISEQILPFPFPFLAYLCFVFPFPWDFHSHIYAKTGMCKPSQFLLVGHLLVLFKRQPLCSVCFYFYAKKLR